MANRNMMKHHATILTCFAHRVTMKKDCDTISDTLRPFKKEKFYSGFARVGLFKDQILMEREINEIRNESLCSLKIKFYLKFMYCFSKLIVKVNCIMNS